jgi:hypothetical protein
VAVNDIPAVLESEAARVLAGVALVVLGYFLEPIKGWFFGPRLVVRFEPADRRHVADSPMVVTRQGSSPQTVQSRWVRISLENTGRSHLKDTEAFVVSVEREQQGRWAPTSFIDPLRLPWGSTNSETAYLTRDLPTGVPFFVDVCRSMQGAPWGVDALDLATQITPLRLQHLFSERSRYRMTVKIIGTGVKPATLRVIVTWTGVWDELKTSKG